MRDDRAPILSAVSGLEAARLIYDVCEYLPPPRAGSSAQDYVHLDITDSHIRKQGIPLIHQFLINKSHISASPDTIVNPH